MAMMQASGSAAIANGNARAGGLARTLSGLIDTAPAITLMHRAGANVPVLMPPDAQAGALPALMNADALAGGGEGAAGGTNNAAGDAEVFSTAAGVRDGSGMSLNEVAQTLGLHARALKRPAAAKKQAAVSVKKKPAAAPKPKAGKVDYSKAKRDNGCPKCRGREGCAPSCVILNTRPYPC